MKADIPDSITINRDKEGVLHHSYWTTDQQLVPFESTLYIRKDTLLEIIKEESKFWDDGEMIFRALIEKINSL